MNSISKNAYINTLADTVNKYSNTYHRTNKIRSADVNSSIYIGTKFEVADYIQNI